MSNYIEPEIEKIKLGEDNLEDVSGGLHVSKDIDGKYCAKIKTDGDNFDKLINGEGRECTIKFESERRECSIKVESERSACRID